MDEMDPKERMNKLTAYSNSVEVDPNQPIIRYYRSGKEMVRMASVYQAEKNYENAFILYIKFTTLFVERIVKHPEYKSFDPVLKKQNNDKVREIFPIAEQLKKQILARYQDEYETYLIIKKMQEDERLEAAARAAAESATAAVTAAAAAAIAADAQKQRKASNTEPMPGPSTSTQPSAPPDLSHILYPNDFPTDPHKSNLPSTGLILPDANKSPPTKPTFDRKLKPTTSTDSLMEGCLRKVVVPKDTMSKFLSLASKNTANNIETCGILVGRLAQNLLNITHVIVPKQHGTPDSCTTMNEEEIFDIQDQHNLITIGWIHTHPTQTSFLSSVDLHTHCSYQIMMPEAIAIVCAPKYQSNRYLCLTPNYGLDLISSCREPGFHPHPNSLPLFMDATHVIIESALHIEVIDLRR